MVFVTYIVGGSSCTTCTCCGRAAPPTRPSSGVRILHRNLSHALRNLQGVFFKADALQLCMATEFTTIPALFDAMFAIVVRTGSFRAAHADMKKAHKRYLEGCKRRGVTTLAAPAAPSPSSAVPSGAVTAQVYGAATAVEEAVLRCQECAQGAHEATGAVVSALAAMAESKTAPTPVQLKQALDLAVKANSAASTSISSAAAAAQAVNALQAVVGCGDAKGGTVMPRSPAPTTAPGLRAAIDDSNNVGCVPSISGASGSGTSGASNSKGSEKEAKKGGKKTKTATPAGPADAQSPFLKENQVGCSLHSVHSAFCTVLCVLLAPCTFCC